MGDLFVNKEWRKQVLILEGFITVHLDHVDAALLRKSDPLKKEL